MRVMSAAEVDPADLRRGPRRIPHPFLDRAPSRRRCLPDDPRGDAPRQSTSPSAASTSPMSRRTGGRTRRRRPRHGTAPSPRRSSKQRYPVGAPRVGEVAARTRRSRRELALSSAHRQARQRQRDPRAARRSRRRTCWRRWLPLTPPRSNAGGDAASSEDGSDAWARRLLRRSALILPWWLPLLADTTATFYKELAHGRSSSASPAWLPRWPRPRRRVRRARIRWCLPALRDRAGARCCRRCCSTACGARPRSSPSACCCFVVSLHLSIHLRARLGERTFAWLAACVAIAALGSCVFAGIQLFGLDAAVHGVVARNGNRLYGNVAQANQFADLLWVGAIGWSGSQRRVGSRRRSLAFWSSCWCSSP